MITKSERGKKRGWREVLGKKCKGEGKRERGGRIRKNGVKGERKDRYWWERKGIGEGCHGKSVTKEGETVKGRR